MSEVNWKTARRQGGTRFNAEAIKTFLPGLSSTLPPTNDPALLDAAACKSQSLCLTFLLLFFCFFSFFFFFAFSSSCCSPDLSLLF
jgi:hypothetical protein